MQHAHPVSENSPGPSCHLGTGVEWMIDAFECSPERLQDVERLRGIVERAIDELGLNVVGRPQIHRFDTPGGVTLLYMLSESHLTCHTYPEFAIATFNLYCCRERRTWDWEARLKADLKAGRVTIRQIPRGIGGDRPHIDELGSRGGPK